MMAIDSWPRVHAPRRNLWGGPQNPKWIDWMWTERTLYGCQCLFLWKIIQKVVPACAIISKSASVRPRVRIYNKGSRSSQRHTASSVSRRRQRPFNCITTHVALGRDHPSCDSLSQSQFYRDSRPAVWEFTCSSVTMCTPITFTSLCGD